MNARLPGIVLLLSLCMVGCWSVTERHYLVQTEACPGGDSVCCSFERGNVQVRLVVGSTDGLCLTAGMEFVNRGTDTLHFKVNEISAWENGERLTSPFAPTVNGYPCSACSVMTLREKPSDVYASFSRLVKKDKKNSSVTFELGNLYRDSVKVTSLGACTVWLDRYSTETYMVAMKLGLH